MGAFRDLTGQRFNRLTVLKRVEDYVSPKGQHLTRWECLCDCGNIINVTGCGLTQKRTTSCGCYHKEITSNNLVGKVFGRLTVLRDVGSDRQGNIIWECQCSCKKETIVNVIGSSLVRGNTQSCGCYRVEQLQEKHSGESHHNWKGGITPIYSTIRNSIEYTEWRNTIFERDKYTCQSCGDNTGGNLHAHHKNMFSVILEEHNIESYEQAQNCLELWDIDNGITLCDTCHIAEHKG